MDKYVRKITLCDLVVTTNKKHILPWKLEELLALLQDKQGTYSYEMSREGGGVIYYISDVKVDQHKRLATLYVCRHDKTESDPAFSEKSKSGAYNHTIIEKTNEQGAASGAHVVVHLDGKKVDDGYRYLAAVEDASGLGRNICQQVMRAAFNILYTNEQHLMTQSKTTGNPNKKFPFRPLFEFLGIPKDFIEADLLKSAGVQLSLVRLKPQSHLGQAAADFRAEETVVLHPSKQMKFPNTLAQLIDVIKDVPGQLGKATYAYKIGNSTQTLRFKMKGHNVFLDDALVQKHPIGPTKNAMASISSDGRIIDEFASLLSSYLLGRVSEIAE
ncbi:MAG: hypothetical protein AAGF25_13490 [Pseudomonadota bacterium]